MARKRLVKGEISLQAMGLTAEEIPKSLGQATDNLGYDLLGGMSHQVWILIIYKSHIYIYIYIYVYLYSI